MINLNSIKQTYNTKKIKLTEKKKPKSNYVRPPPSEGSLNVVLCELESKPGITRKELHDNTGLSVGLLTRCFNRLLELDKIKRVEIKNYGAYTIWGYYIKESQ